ncbi:MAG: ATP-binding protein [Acidobacteriota bacterium]|nr:ATP-binding protein [Acidobacteriota bacterium]
MRLLDILVVEDNAIDAKVLINVLLRCGVSLGEPDHATSLRAAQAALRIGDYDLVMLDMTLPDSDGLDTLESIKLAVPETPIIVVTANEDREFGIRAIRAGAQDFLVKGRLYQDLLERVVRYAVERHAHERDLNQARLEAQERNTELSRHREHLAELVAERTRELERSYQQLEQFAFVASHDLKEPLRKIQTFGGLLEKEYGDQLNEEARQFLHFMVDAADRMTRLIQDLLALSRLDTGDPFVTVSLDRVFDDVLADLELPLEDACARIQRVSLPEVFGDPLQLHQLFLNLVSNAVKYRDRERPLVITVEAEVNRDGCLVTVSDNGIGFDQADSTSIFEPFKRLHSRKEYPGTGIGLAICKRIVDLHGGDIEAEGETGKGALFRMSFPNKPKN